MKFKKVSNYTKCYGLADWLTGKKRKGYAIVDDNGNRLHRQEDDKTGNVTWVSEDGKNVYTQNDKKEFVDKDGNKFDGKGQFYDDRNWLQKKLSGARDSINKKVNAINKYYKQGDEKAKKGDYSKHNIGTFLKNVGGSTVRGLGRTAAIAGVSAAAGALTGGAAFLPAAMAARGLLRTNNQMKGKNFIDAVREANLRGKQASLDKTAVRAHQKGIMDDKDYGKFYNGNINRTDEIHNAIKPTGVFRSVPQILNNATMNIATNIPILSNPLSASGRMKMGIDRQKYKIRKSL